MLDILLTKLLPESIEGIARHDETTSKADEAALLAQLKSGELRAIASSSTFSLLEGFPFVTHFIFCHLTPSFDEFFKRCKPAFASEETSYLSFIYSDQDEMHIRNWIAQKYPTENELRHLYGAMRMIVQSNGAAGSPEIEMLDGRLGAPLTVRTGFTIFEELQCIARHGESERKRLELLPAQKSELSHSPTYLKGEWIKRTSPSFIQFQLRENIESMWERIENESQIANKPDSIV